MKQAHLLSVCLLLCTPAVVAAQPPEPSAGSERPLVEFEKASGGALAVSNDGHWLAVGADYKGALQLFDLPDRKLVSVLEDVEGTYVSLDFSPDAKLLAVVRVTLEPAENNLSVWNIATKKRVWESKEGVAWARFAPDGKRLAAGKFSSVRFFQPKTGAVLQDFPVHPNAYVGNGEYISTARLFVTVGDEDRRVSVWNAATGKLVNSFTVGEDEVNGLGVSDDGALIAVAQRGQVSVYEGRSGKLKWSKAPAEEWILTLDFRPNSHELATAGQDGTARIWEGASGKELRQIEPEHGMVQAVRYTPDGSELIVGSSGATSIYSAYPRTQSSEYRTWQSSSGKFNIEAKLVGQDGDQVHLIRKTDEKEIVVPIGQLSQSDRNYLSDALMRTSKKSPRLAYELYDHSWHTGLEPDHLISPEDGFAVLAEVSGDFALPTTTVEVGLEGGQQWQLSGKSESAYITAQAYTVENLEPKLFSEKVEFFSWSAGQPPVQMLRKEEGICFLSGIGGALHGYGEHIRVRLQKGKADDQEYWVLEGSTAQPQLSAKAVALRWIDPESITAEVQEVVWSVGDEAKKLLPLDEGLCFLGSVSGKFAGGGEIIRITSDGDAWQLSGQSGQSDLSASAIVVRIHPKN